MEKLIKQYESVRMKEERETYSKACVGEKVCIHLQNDNGDRGMKLHEGEVISIEVRDGELVAKLRDPKHSGLIEFAPAVVVPRIVRTKKA